MKRQTFVDYIGVIGTILCVCAVTSVYGMIMHFLSSDNKIIDTSAESKDMSDIVVVVDPGHGGEDGGAVGVSGVLEKNINFEISNRIKELFDMLDVNCELTRNSDRLLYEPGQENRKKYNDVRNRVRLAKEYENPLFVSIHQNKFPVEKYHGLQVYYSSNNEKSRIIADGIQADTKTYLQPDNNRKTKKAVKNIYVLDALSCPAVLVECGFLSNSREEAMLSDDEYQRKIAFIIFKSLIEYVANEQTSVA